MTSFFRFLSKRAKSSSSSRTQNNTKHMKLNGCEDLKEALENLNNHQNNNNNLKQQSDNTHKQCAQIRSNNLNKSVNDDSSLTTTNTVTQNATNNRTASIFQSFKSFKSRYKQQQSQQQAQQNSKDNIECAVIFLDGSDTRFFINKKSNADKLYEKVFYHLDLIETDYFGLQYTDTHNVQHWLDPSKCIRKQCKIGPPYTFFFKVKFYTAEPNNLKEEITRYLYYLQLKSDIRTGKLPCTHAIAIELGALTLQEELGDYDSQMHTIETVSEFRFVPDVQQNEELEDAILKQYKTKCVGLTPAEAELTYLNKAKWLEMYGVDMHQVFGRDENEYKLGLTPSGILVFEGEQKIGLFYWPKIEKVQFSKKKFTIIVVEDDDRGYKQEHTFIFHLIDEKACKHLWKCAVEYHSFFRLRTAPKPVVGGISGFIRRGSRFRGPQRTEFQTTNQTLSTRRSVQFERRPSQRFSRRASYAIKRKLQEQQKIREQSQPATTTRTTTATTTTTHEISAKTTSDVSEKSSASSGTVADTSALITFDTPTTTTAAAAGASGLSIKEEAENAQARLKQIEIESDMPPPPPPPSVFTANGVEKKLHPPQIPPPVPARVQRSSVVATSTGTPTAAATASSRHVHGNCCKLQQTSGGNEHDIKCNLLKAQKISSKKSEQQQQVETTNSCCQTCEKESSKTCSKSIDNDETPLIGSSSVTTTAVATTCSANNSSNCSNNNNNDENLLDKNEQQMVDDKVKLIDKEFISSLSANTGSSSTTTTSTSKRSSQLILPPLPPPITPTPASSAPNVTNTNHQTQSAYIKESSFITPTSLIGDLTTSAGTTTTTTTTTLPLTTTTTTTMAGTSSNKSQHQQQQPQAEVIITRTQSIYNDRSATAAILQINQKTTSFASNCSSSHANKRLSNASNMCNRPITTEL